MILLDLIFYSVCRCELGPNDGHVTAKGVLSLFIFSNVLLIANIFSLCINQKRITQTGAEYLCDLLCCCIGLFIYLLVSRHYNRDKTGVEQARSLMKKWNKDSLIWYIVINIIVFLYTILTPYISFLIESSIVS